MKLKRLNTGIHERVEIAKNNNYHSDSNRNDSINRKGRLKLGKLFKAGIQLRLRGLRQD